MKIINAIGIALFAIIAFSCSNRDAKIKSEKITKENLISLKEKIKSSNELSAIELDYFNAALLRYGTADSIAGKTVKEVIDGQEQFIKNNQYKNIDINLTALQMNELVKVQFLQKVKGADSLKQDLDGLEYKMKNNSGRDVKIARGYAKFYLPDGTFIKQIYLNREAPLKANAEVNETLFWQFEKGNPRDSVLRFSPQALKVIWLPETIEYSNGEKLTIKE